MSRIGKQPVKLASGLEAKLEGNKLVIKKGQESKVIDTKGVVKVNIKDDIITFEPVNDTKFSRSMWGTARALTNNTIAGLINGFEKKLEINGVGYRAAVKGNVLELQLGYSHPINYNIPTGITIAVEKNIISVKGSDKQQVGQVAAEIRSFRKPEPYKGKGVKYVSEHIIRKAGKTAKK